MSDITERGHYDVVIAGGSLAGAATAIHLARAGRSVVIVERSAFPRRKPCGEGMFPYGVAEMASLGVTADCLPESAPLRELHFHAGSAVATAPLGRSGHGIGIRRELLDAAVLDAARAAGVEVLPGVTAQGFSTKDGIARSLRTSAGDIPARVIIGADGLQSRIRRLAGLDGPARGTRYGVTAHVELPEEPPPAVEVFFEGGFDVYRTPVGGRSANVAILLEKREMTRFAGRLEAAYLETLFGHPAVGSSFSLEHEPIAAGPFARSCRRAWRGNVVLVGDAAGFFDGITGDGMSSALVTARLCAKAVDQYLEAGDFAAFRTYESQRKAVGRNARLLARVTLGLARRPLLARYAVRNMQRHPESFRRLVDVGSSESGLRSLRPRDLSALAIGF